MPDNHGKPLHFSGDAEGGMGMAEIYRQLREGLVGKTVADVRFGDVGDGEPGEYVDFQFSDGTNLVLIAVEDGTFFVDLTRSTSHS